MRPIILYFALFLGAAHGSEAETPLHAPPTLDAAHAETSIVPYESYIAALASNPKPLSDVPLWALQRYFYNVVGFRLKDKLSPDQWSKLRKAETQFIGLLVLAVTSQMDPSADVKNASLPISYPSFEMADPNQKDWNDQVKRKAYEDSVQAKMRADSALGRQIELKQYLPVFLLSAKKHLSLLYPDQTVPDPDEKKILSAVGLDDATINKLLENN